MKEIKEVPDIDRNLWLPGNATCAGCGLDLSLRWALKALGPRTVLVTPASCLNVVIGVWPKAAPDFPFINMVFAGGAAAATGIYHGLKARGIEDVNVMTYAGDGGTTDIGIQGLSGAAERGTNIIYVCYDNEAYMNTGIQRSSSTPLGAITTTTYFGKQEHKKNLPAIMAAHNIPYVATASVADPLDLYDKFKKAKDIKGLKYIHIYAPCPPGWKIDSERSIEVAKKAITSGMWILYEVENGVFRLTGKSKRYIDPKKRKPIKDYLTIQGRFRKLTDDDFKELEKYRDSLWRQVNKELSFQELEEK
ncbi:MAG: 3-methyl-2-oxobutanoate dehydrogenase subunit beta [Candidatus Lokiarchaeota archaeon]|nr:3-methyl-2-oxobutanoate dehydrogenase subunit beta [Candidatus Lokiarchaeota archaeon]